MVDQVARRALFQLTHLIHQTIQISGNHLHLSVIAPQLEQIRKELYEQPAPVAHPPAPVAHVPALAPQAPPAPASHLMKPIAPFAFQQPPAPAPVPHPDAVAVERTSGTIPAPPDEAEALAMSFGVPADAPGCLGCGRRPVDLIASGHAGGCAALSGG